MVQFFFLLDIKEKDISTVLNETQLETKWEIHQFKILLMENSLKISLEEFATQYLQDQEGCVFSASSPRRFHVIALYVHFIKKAWTMVEHLV